jgi:hypothetical protein
MRGARRAAVWAAAALATACASSTTETQGRETPAQARRIIAQALCLAEAYPGTAIAADSASLVAAYQGMLGGRAGVTEIGAVRELARTAKPGTPTPVDDRNFGIARCVLFADRPDVLALLGG